MKLKKSNRLKSVFNFIKSNYFFIGIPLLIITAAALLQPTVRANWDNSYRNNLLNEWISSIAKENVLNAQEFWLFRERYSPGHFTYNPDHVDLYQTFRIVDRNNSGKSELLYYHSPRIKSVESITTNNNELNEIVAAINSELILLKSENLLIYRDVDDNSTPLLHLYFLKSIDEMRKTNGFFDYLSSEREILEGTYWLHYSKIFHVMDSF
ncbi:MAG: hypothetical protein XD98_0110 [Microgenomates bacterium 39_6]|nr:MAG: hypothetical protein XD98_0110 [Microgenomates bacterium 39_6]